MATMDKSFQAGVVLVMSIWKDDEANMLWLDSNYPLDRPSSQPGVARGTCSASPGTHYPTEIEYPNSSVTFSNIRFGDIGSTYEGGSTSAIPDPSSPPTSDTVPQYGQCGGQDYTGPTTCAAPSKCELVNQWYSRCL
ncbi:unnamed protein product [Rhizoctonia solani]|uniref:Glucanase n=1 Tax=Rhizoctonia solani TaxID=456999 RepID=A0A8H2XZS6_9AGAM|nr:unnamed protein product [Rhizoctonia solani]